MEKLPPPDPLQLTGDISGNWKRFQQKLELYLVAIQKDSAGHKTRVAILLTVAGTEALELYNTFTFVEADKNEHGVVKFESVIQKFADHCDPKKNETYERYVFRSRVQKELEPIATFITDLKVKARTCSFEDKKDGIIRDQIIIGVLDTKLKERLLREKDLTLAKTEELCRASEAAHDQMERIAKAATNKSEEAQVDVINNITNCTRCNGRHYSNNCPAMGKTCFACNGRDHLAVACKTGSNRGNTNNKGSSSRYNNRSMYSNNNNNRGTNNSYNNRSTRKPGSNGSRKVNTLEQYDNNDEDSEFFIDSIMSDDKYDAQRYEWLVTLHLFTDNLISFKIDSGAQANCIPFDMFTTISPRPNLIHKNIKLKTYNEGTIPVLGICRIKVYIHGKWQSVLFTIVKGDFQPIIGIGTALRFGFLDIPRSRPHSLQVHEVSQEQSRVRKTDTWSILGSTALAEKVKHTYPGLFEGLGRFQEEYVIKLKADYRPVIHPVRKVPLAYKDRIEKELTRMESLGVISRIYAPSAPNL